MHGDTAHHKAGAIQRAKRAFVDRLVNHAIDAECTHISDGSSGHFGAGDLIVGFIEVTAASGHVDDQQHLAVAHEESELASLVDLEQIAGTGDACCGATVRPVQTVRCCGVHRAVRCEPVPLLIRHHRLLGAPAV